MTKYIRPKRRSCLEPKFFCRNVSESFKKLQKYKDPVLFLFKDRVRSCLGKEQRMDSPDVDRASCKQEKRQQIIPF